MHMSKRWGRNGKHTTHTHNIAWERNNNWARFPKDRCLSVSQLTFLCSSHRRNVLWTNSLARIPLPLICNQCDREPTTILYIRFANAMNDSNSTINETKRQTHTWCWWNDGGGGGAWCCRWWIVCLHTNYTPKRVNRISYYLSTRNNVNTDISRR